MAILELNHICVRNARFGMSSDSDPIAIYTPSTLYYLTFITTVHNLMTMISVVLYLFSPKITKLLETNCIYTEP